jgi:hypothetical protein
MRINILQAGLVTYLMAGRGLLPKGDDEPKSGPDTESWNSVVLPDRFKPAPKNEPH